MNYNALIENRKSVRAFKTRPVPETAFDELRSYYAQGCQRLDPGIPTELRILGTDAREALEGSAGYEDFLIGAPAYLVLLSEDRPHAVLNGGYMMEDLILKLEDMGLDSCWITFTDSDKVKAALGICSEQNIVALAAFGYGQRTAKRIRLNIFSMSNVDISAKRAYFSPKKDITELAFVDTVGNTEGLEACMGFYDDMLWQALYAVAQTPSYLNRQPYAFLLRDRDVYLLRMPDAYTDDLSADQNLGIALLHFSAVAGQWLGKLRWDLEPRQPELPQGCTAVALCHL